MRPKPKSAYVIRSDKVTRDGTNHWVISKLDTDYNMHDTYTLQQERSGLMTCSCYAGRNFKPCRHKQMLEMFTKEGAIDTGRMYVYDKQYWIEPANLEE